MEIIPSNNLRRHYVAHAELLSGIAAEVMASGYWINGPRNEAFCRAFAASLGVAFCVGVANGTDALEIALRALLAEDASGENRREIVTVANAGGYTTTACRILGCTPVFADIDPATQLLSIDAAIAALGERTAAIVVTHLYGGLVDVPGLRSAMNAAGYGHMPILEDCAQSHGLRGCGGAAGAFGDVATFSFYPTKNLGALGDGGAIVTSRAALADRVASLRQYGWSRKYEIALAGGRNSRLDEIQAALLSGLLPGLDRANARRVEILDAYAAAAPAGMRVVRSPHGSVGHLAVVLTEDRERLRRDLTAAGISSEVHYPILDCDQPGWAALPQRIGPAGLAASRHSVERILTLPCFPELTEAEQARVCAALAAFEP